MDQRHEWNLLICKMQKKRAQEMQNNLYKSLPFNPTYPMWSGLARDIVMWTRLYNNSDQTGANLFKHLRSLGHVIPAWLLEEVADSDTVPPKGTVAVIVYKAMFYACHGEAHLKTIEQRAEEALRLAGPVIQKIVDAGLGGMEAALAADAIKLVNEMSKAPNPELCVDEGCPQHGTDHICVTKADVPEPFGTALQALQFASTLDDHYDVKDFVSAWFAGDIEEFPEYIEFLKNDKLAEERG